MNMKYQKEIERHKEICKELLNTIPKNNNDRSKELIDSVTNYHLLEYAFSKELEKKTNREPLIYSIQHRNYEITEYLLENGADPYESESEIDGNKFNRVIEETTKTRENSVEILDALMKHGMTVEKLEEYGAIYMSIYQNDIKMVKKLLELGVDPNKIKDEEYRKKEIPLSEATECINEIKERLEIIEKTSKEKGDTEEMYERSIINEFGENYKEKFKNAEEIYEILLDRTEPDLVIKIGI